MSKSFFRIFSDFNFSKDADAVCLVIPLLIWPTRRSCSSRPNVGWGTYYVIATSLWHHFVFNIFTYNESFIYDVIVSSLLRIKSSVLFDSRRTNHLQSFLSVQKPTNPTSWLMGEEMSRPDDPLPRSCKRHKMLGQIESWCPQRFRLRSEGQYVIFVDFLN